MNNKNSKLVYSTDPELKNQLAQDEKQSSSTVDLPPEKQTIQIILQTKGRQGKPVTVLKNFEHSNENLKLLARDLKQFCGAGGTVKGNEIEIQGDKRQILSQRLIGKGYNVKLG